MSALTNGTPPIATALGGTLERRADGWCWRDGSPEPRVRDMSLDELSPNFRCCRRGNMTYVEVPARWRDARYWPAGRIDTQAAVAIAELLREAGGPAEIYAEGLAEALDDHRLTARGWLVDVAQWDAAMREPCGCRWDRRDEADILAIAKAMGWKDAP